MRTVDRWLEQAWRVPGSEPHVSLGGPRLPHTCARADQCTAFLGAGWDRGCPPHTSLSLSLRVGGVGIARGPHISCCLLSALPQDNHDREVQELRQLQRLKEQEQKRHSWATGELGFGRSSSENDVELLTKRSAEDLSPFLHPRPISPSYRPPNTRRSRLSLGTSADRELLTFLESSTHSPEVLNKFNSLPRRSPRQARPTVAWMDPGEAQDGGPRVAQEPQASEGQEKATKLPSAWQSQPPAPQPEEPAPAFPRAQRGGPSILRKRNSEPVGLGPAWAPPFSPLALGIKEHELVTGLAQFSLQGPKGQEETSLLTLSDFSPVELASVGDGTPPSLRAGSDSLTPVDRGPQEGLSPAPEDYGAAPDEPSSAALASVGSSDPESKDPGPLPSVSDATDCSLTLDCSEGADCRPAPGEPEDEREGDGSVSSGVGELGSSQVSSNPASTTPGEVPSPVSMRSEPGCKDDLPRDRPSRGKDVMGPKRNSLKEAPLGAAKPGAVRRSPGAAPKPVRTLTASENESMRKVVPISRASRASGGWKRPEPPPRGSPRDTPSSTDTLLRRSSVKGTSDTSPRRSSVGAGATAAEEQRLSRGSSNARLGKEPPLQPRGSLKKPSAKPLRNIPRQKPEENKVCRSTSQDPESPEEEPKAPPAPSVPRAPPPVPSFARNTVASSSRCQRTDSSAVAKAPGITRTVSQRQLRVKGSPEDAASKDSSILRRASSARVPKKCPESAESPGANVDASLKGRGLGERASLRLKDSGRTTLGRILNPLHK